MQPLDLSHLTSKLDRLGDGSRRQVARYLELIRSRNYADNTLRSVATAVNRFLASLPAARQSALGLELVQTTCADIDSFVASARDRELAPNTINTTLSLLKEFFDFLLEEGELRQQPIRRRRHRVFAPLTLPKPMAEADLVAFFKAIDSVRDRLIFLLMLRCGLRVSEVSRLRWEELDLAEGTVRVNNGKGQVDRVLYLSPDVTETLRAWSARRPTADWLFPSSGPPAPTIATRTIYRIMLRYMAEAGVGAHYSPHSLRHTFATQLLNAGVTLEVLKELMGHRSLNMTLRYTQIYEATKRRQYDQAMEQIEQRQGALRGAGR
jgi:site-specific recombinase XerD